MHIIVKDYQHYNRSLPNWDSPKGKYIRSKEHYESELKKAGMVRCDDFGQVTEPKRKEYTFSSMAKEIVSAAKNSKDKKGNVKLSDRTIEALESIGAINKKVPEYMRLPAVYQEGGFSD